MKLAIVNGPNLNLLGNREPQIYGVTPWDAFFDELEKGSNSNLSYYQSNVEGELINFIQGFDGDGIILNAGATRIQVLPCAIAFQLFQSR